MRALCSSFDSVNWLCWVCKHSNAPTIALVSVKTSPLSSERLWFLKNTKTYIFSAAIGRKNHKIAYVTSWCKALLISVAHVVTESLKCSPELPLTLSKWSISVKSSKRSIELVLKTVSADANNRERSLLFPDPKDGGVFVGESNILSSLYSIFRHPTERTILIWQKQYPFLDLWCVKKIRIGSKNCVRVIIYIRKLTCCIIYSTFLYSQNIENVSLLHYSATVSRFCLIIWSLVN